MNRYVKLTRKCLGVATDLSGRTLTALAFQRFCGKYTVYLTYLDVFGEYMSSSTSKALIYSSTLSGACVCLL